MKLGTILLLCSFLAASSLAQKKGESSKGGDEVRVLIEASKPYDALVSKIEQLGGVVYFQYKNIDAVAASVPADQLNAVAGLDETRTIVEDRIVNLGEPQALSRAGFGEVKDRHDLDAGDVVGEVSDFVSVAPDGYFPTEAALTRATEFWSATGHLGEGVIVGIMDTGLGDVPAITGRIAGGENFVPVTPSLDDGIPAVSGANDPHGTWVATVAGANVAFCIPAGVTISQSIRIHLPAASIPNGCGTGVDLIPMVGQAPLAEFFALKVFNNLGQTSFAILLAAFDRAIELKELYDAGSPDGVNIRVLNGSFGGSTLFAGEDPFFAGMVHAIIDAGIVPVFSAGNVGPSGITGGDPGTARNALTVAATNVAAFERILRDVQFGLGIGSFYRPNPSHQVAYFSSRGPTADGRMGPSIAAPGFAIFVQGANGGLSLASGTSFSAPNVAGVAALLLSAFPNATPDQVRGALLAGANPELLEDGSRGFDRGFGFVDAMSAHENFGAPSPPDEGQENKNVKVNLQRAGVKVINSRNASSSTGWLLPGERSELYFDVAATDVGMTVMVTVTQELPPAQQNLFFGDDALVAIHSAKTSRIGTLGDYRAGTPAFVFGTATFELGPSDLDAGIARVTVMGDWTNAGRIRADVQIVTDKQGLSKSRPINGMVAQDELRLHTLSVPQGTMELGLTLAWPSDWSQWPTNDLDLFVFDPDGNLILIDADGDGDLDGLSLDAPERVMIANPTPGLWTLVVDGFTVWNGTESYQIIARTSTGAAKQDLAEAELPNGYLLTEAYPNPFNPETQFTLQVAEDQRVRIEVFDLLGRRVALLHDGAVQAGEVHSFRFEASQLPSGPYFYRAAGEAFEVTRHVVLVK